ncbi:acetyl-coenzyme A synthetase 2-like, mitochondrial isoform X2 [Falco biarmicus]|uniref:acetyl-coenzyme A synthetase 2-like, mitochondrial isoform X2 n=1 Tax=Falco cherrug TaxID=345164 RepID=UPI00247AD079|nr:acetyl-coenzyme A synthetase 2-like, mitochondrial isoform X2 [Falco cherrug]XP_055672117.1 acetyl-coenzyme A synthetase 2-like, mitochondrial isoform X2 [Falco peregrinus]XP_056213069.1 acetyl-coenzyme A synthetase 2-like, mitochondrial isoform X2 [Falco biarmicus]
MELAAVARARVLGALRRPLSPRRVPGSGRRCRSDAGDPAALPPGGYRLWQERAARDPAAFWAEVARGTLRWDSPFHTACQPGPAAARWFLGGRLNVSVNCLDQHVERSPNRVALIWERDEPGTAVHVTYRELLDLTCRLANTLKKYGIQKGDKVAIYMSVSPLSVAAMLACARIGAIHTVVFAGFSAESLAGRIMDSGCKAVITYNQGVRGGRIVELKTTVDEAVKNCPSIKHVFVAQRTDNKVQMGDSDIPLEEEMAKAASVCTPESMDSEDVLFMLYTSGSTGKPKGIVHTQAGYLLYAAVTHKHVFDYQQGDVFGCVADIGWITGHSYVVYGPLCNGATSVLFESTPVYPDPGRYWEVVQRLKINQFYGAPTAIRLLLNYGEEWVKKYDRSSLKTLGSVGEPINSEAWHWFYWVVGEGRCTLVDTWWQTGYYFTGDGAYRTKKGYYQITGRMDDVINISGHRLGTAEIEDAMADHPEVPETAVIGYPHKIKGEGAFAFIVLKEQTAHIERVKEELKTIVASKIAKYAVPDHILVVKRLPKTRSGKIMRRLLRKVVTEQSSNMGDVTTLDDPSVVKEILDAYQKYKEKSSS